MRFLALVALVVACNGTSAATPQTELAGGALGPTARRNTSVRIALPGDANTLHILPLE